MKILIAGATGSIGGECVKQCLAHPRISSVVAFSRREVHPDIASHPKLTSILLEDFARWPEDILRSHADAAAMLWAIGSYNGNRAVDFEYPLAFLESIARVLKARSSREQPQFKYIHLGGMFTSRDPDAKLWLLGSARRIRGLAEVKVAEFADRHDDILKTIVIRPGGVATKDLTGSRTVIAILGPSWGIRLEELGAFMTYLAVDGEGESAVIENHRIALKGREALKLAAVI